MERDDGHGAELCLCLAYEYVTLLLTHPSEEKRRIGLAILKESTLKQRLACQMSHADLAGLADIPKRRLASHLEEMEAEHMITRDRSGSAGSGRRGGDTRGDLYGVKIPEAAEERLRPPTRAGPTKERPTTVDAAVGRQGAAFPPTGIGEHTSPNQDDST